MRHSIALVTGTTSGLGHAAARLLAIEGYSQVIITGRSLARVRQTAAQLAAETKTQVFTPLELDLDAPTSVQSALAELVRLGQPIDFLLLNAGWIGGKERVLTAAGIEAAQVPLIGHHQLTVGKPDGGHVSTYNITHRFARFCAGSRRASEAGEHGLAGSDLKS